AGLGTFGAGSFPDGPNNTVLVDVTWSDVSEYTKNPSGMAAGAKSHGLTAAGLFANTLLHETGHLWGLSHTSDIGFDDDRDGLDDTPHCDAARLGTADDRCPDRSNLMYPYAQLDDHVELSPQQTTVLRSAAGYRPYAVAPNTMLASAGA